MLQRCSLLLLVAGWLCASLPSLSQLGEWAKGIKTFAHHERLKMEVTIMLGRAAHSHKTEEAVVAANPIRQEKSPPLAWVESAWPKILLANPPAVVGLIGHERSGIKTGWENFDRRGLVRARPLTPPPRG